MFWTGDTMMVRSGILMVAGAVVLCLDVITGDAQSRGPSFEVASIRPNTSGDAGSGSTRDPGRVTVYNMTLRDLIRQAYEVKLYQVTGGPDWLGSDRFDVVATTEGNPNQERLRLMMQRLLAERFGLVIHRERKQLPAYMLLAARGGARLEKAKDGKRSFSIFPLRGIIRGTGSSTAELADGLSGILDRPVLDQSGLRGSFDFQLEYAPLSASGAAGDAAPSVFTALQEQLGLKLEPTTAPIEIIVIDRVEQPTEN
jgi:bla regulator protein blaR1